MMCAPGPLFTRMPPARARTDTDHDLVSRATTSTCTRKHAQGEILPGTGFAKGGQSLGGHLPIYSGPKPPLHHHHHHTLSWRLQTTEIDTKNTTQRRADSALSGEPVGHGGGGFQHRRSSSLIDRLVGQNVTQQSCTPRYLKIWS